VLKKAQKAERSSYFPAPKKRKRRKGYCRRPALRPMLRKIGRSLSIPNFAGIGKGATPKDVVRLELQGSGGGGKKPH